ncbi:phenylalanine--tRNA ligase subunit beta [Sediminitomix flava]|uniref:Phenylalanine--tRNA ligase beta subunit n=1 Tax=Sediminitomix flava TaxID=379075 RepID=A0A315ZJJ1_SEDFL|nr:phenylalanine--tRNA ligase subunit beta [Sediminitomix flava]PWJ44998.1 phenylalanyl-tRNA synthetase beta subunit [Sediminitomix flava]
MKISIDWLKEYIDFDKSAEEIDHILTMGGLEVEGIEKFEPIEGGLAGLVIGEVVECGKHPGADKLSLTKVDVGGEELLPIVCGAPNVAAGQKVVVATVGTMLYPSEGEAFKIKKGKIRGEVSMGMICAEDEIGLGASHDGIMVLDTDVANGTPAADYFDLDTTDVVEIGLTPNRVDAASHYGVARDLKVLLEKEIKFPSTEAFKVANTNRTIAVEVENTEACPRYTGLTISGLTVAPSPEWLQNRLKSIGLAPINNVVDATNYIMHGLGQPLHAFDADEVKGDKIVVKLANEGEKFVTLDEEERTLAAADLMICNAEEPMCIAGVFGGLHSGVSDKTTSIFLESAYFSPDFVRKTSQRHGIKTDSSFRFERGTDPNLPAEALKVAALLIQEVAGGEVSSEVVDTNSERVADFVVNVKYKHIDRLIGKEIPKEEVHRILEGLEMTFLSDSEEEFTISVPPYRVDVQREADIIEEILRIIGFNSVELSEDLHSDFLAHFPKKDKEVLQAKVTEMLAGAGMNEIMTNSLTTHTYAEAVESLNSEKNVEILNILSADLDVMRQTLLFSALEVVNHNVNRRQTNLKMFEFGKIYRKEENGYEEDAKLSLVMTGDVTEESWRAASKPSTFHDLQKYTNFIFQKLNILDIDQDSLEDDRFAYGLSLSKKGKHIGVIGKVAPKVAKVVGVKQEVFYAELDWSVMLDLYSADYVFTEIPKYPAVRRDLSLVMSSSTKFAQVKELAMKTERKLLKDVNVFDVYEGEHLEEGKKSYSVSFILQDTQKTLNDKAIDKVMKRLMSSFERELNILIRK